MDLNKKQNLALKRLEYAYKIHGDGLFLGHSGGKDSCVIHHLSSIIMGNNFKIVHNVKPLLGTSNDKILMLTEMHPLTLEFLYTNLLSTNEVVFLHHSNMSEFIKKNKLTCQVDGARIAEYNRPGKSSNIIRNNENVNRLYMKEYEECGIFNLAIIYPILDWSNNDVFDYLCNNKINFSKEYIVNNEYNDYLRNKNEKGI